MRPFLVDAIVSYSNNDALIQLEKAFKEIPA